MHVFSHIIRKQTWESALEAGKDLPDTETQPTLATARFIHIGESKAVVLALSSLLIEPSTNLTTVPKKSSVTISQPKKPKSWA